MSNTFVAIMAGGIGSRFWPASRAANPKQFLDILGVGKSLIRLTYERFLGITDKSQIYIVTNSTYFELVKEHLPEINDDQIICEPSRNNTAPCVAYTALKIENINPNANLIVAPSDHIILQESKFLDLIKLALDYSHQNDALLTLGIQPTRPDTGYGYIQFDGNQSINPVVKFTEKPPLELAQTFIEAGNYLWNAGIFVWSVKSILKAFKQYASEITDILGANPSVYNTPAEKSFIQKNYPLTPNISIDFAIMEKAKNVFTIPGSFGWSDLGTWASLYSEMPKSEENNVVQSEKIILENVHHSLFRLPSNKYAVVKGLNDFLVIDSDDVLLIWPKSEEQNIKNMVEKAKNIFPDADIF
ncbi:MAG: mannose-1-phosphate guanylyltransferase [Saprospiraceae bacterium]|jgi:mannose-1-phosphate guanylyltransferase